MKHRVSTFIMIFFGVGKVFAQSDSLSEKQEKQKHLQLQEVSIQVIRAERTWPVTETLLGEKQIERNYTGQEMPVILARTPPSTGIPMAAITPATCICACAGSTRRG